MAKPFKHNNSIIPDNEKKGVSIVSHELRSIEYGSPLPPPDLLNQYESIFPGLKDKIVSMIEDESNHRRGMEKVLLQLNQDQILGDNERQSRGQWFAFGIAIVFAVSACYCAYLDQRTIGGILGGSTLISLVGAFLEKKKSDRVEESKPTKTKDK